MDKADNVATGKFEWEMKVGKKWKKGEMCKEGRVNGERSISP